MARTGPSLTLGDTNGSRSTRGDHGGSPPCGGILDGVPELPEVEALAAFLRERAAGHVVARLDVAGDQRAEDVRPAADGDRRARDHRRRAVREVPRHRDRRLRTGAPDALHLVIHLSRAGWLHWREKLPPAPPKPGRKVRSPLRVHLDDGSGFDLTEQGTQKRLAVYLVRDGHRRSRHRPARAGPARPGVHRRTARRAARRARWPAQGRAPRPVDDRRDRQRILRRDPARGQAVAVQARREAVRGRAVPAARGDLVDHAASTRSTARSGRRRRRSRRRSGPGCGCTPAPACPARSAATPCARSPSPIRSLQYCPTCQTGGKPLADRRMSKLLK